MTLDEAIAILSDMKIDIPVPKAAVTQKKRNVALDMAISALNCSEIPNSSDTISRQAAVDIYDDYNVAVENGELEAYGKHRKRLLELPSAQPATNCSEIPNGSDDTISRQAAIDALDIAIERYDEMAEEYQKKADIERNDYMGMRDDAYEARQLAQWLNELKYLRGKIEQLTIKLEPHWIPCSERLPSKNGEYIVTEKRYAVDDRNHDGRYQVIVEEADWCGKWNRAKFFEVTAWMPLPEPYRGGEK